MTARRFKVTLTCEISEFDDEVSDIDMMAAVGDFVADQVPRFFPTIDCEIEGEIL